MSDENKIFTDKMILRCLVPLAIAIVFNIYCGIKTSERITKIYELQREVSLHILDRVETLEKGCQK
jgi:hypothetical protein